MLDVGCGTGSLSKLVTEAGHQVTGVDLAPKMVEQARAKLRAAGLKGRFLVGDAAHPPTGDERYDVAAVRPLVADLRVEDLSHDADLWGGPVADERYALIARV